MLTVLPVAKYTIMSLYPLKVGNENLILMVQDRFSAILCIFHVFIICDFLW